MVGTFAVVDYRLRPAKHAERTMLIDLFRRLRFGAIEGYQYVGFGSVAFVDFKMVHRALGITHLISIEDVSEPSDKARFRKNKPLRNIKLKFGNSTAVLPTIDFTRPSIVWLDYDGSLSRSMANDMATVVRNVPSGSFLGITLTTSFRHGTPAKEQAEFARLKAEFHEYVDPSIKMLTFQNGKHHAEFARNALGDLLKRSLADENSGLSDPLDRREARQVCYFKYSDGAPMITIGWMIVAARDLPKFDECRFEDLPFARFGDIAFKVIIPKITPMEIREMERGLPNLLTSPHLRWIPQIEREAFAGIHRYLPSFGNVEPV